MKMMQQRMRAALKTRRGRLVAVFLVLVALVGGGYTFFAHGATSLEITVWTHVTIYYADQSLIPDKQIFDKTITDQQLVHDTQRQFDGLERGIRGGCALISPDYEYKFSFATYGVTTEVYSGSLACAVWSVTTLGIPLAVAGADDTTLYGYNLMTTLRKLIGMPLPSGWDAIFPAS